MTSRKQGIPANGVAIKAFRTRLGVSQEQVAREAGCSAMYVSQLERGERKAARIDKLTGIADALRVDVRAIMAVPNSATPSSTEQVTSGRVA